VTRRLPEVETTVTLGLALALVNFGFQGACVDGDLQQAEMSRRLGLNRDKKAECQTDPVRVYPGLDSACAIYTKDKIAEFFARGSFEQCLNGIRIRLLRLRVGRQCPSWPS